MNNDFKDIMQNRKSIRHYDPSVKISRDELLEIINESILLQVPATCSPGTLLLSTLQKARRSFTIS